MSFFKQAADALGANKAMLSLIKSGKVSDNGKDLFQEGVTYGEKVVAEGIEKGEISRLEAMQAEKAGADEVVRHYSK